MAWRAGRRLCYCGEQHKRTFHIYPDAGVWMRWCCTLCQPPAMGARGIRYHGGAQAALEAVIGISMKHHFGVRASHHAFVRSHGSAARRG